MEQYAFHFMLPQQSQLDAQYFPICCRFERFTDHFCVDLWFLFTYVSINFFLGYFVSHNLVYIFNEKL